MVEVKKKYWYKTYITECPVCFGGDTVRERQYSWPPPEKWAQERYEYIQSWDGCNAF